MPMAAIFGIATSSRSKLIPLILLGAIIALMLMFYFERMSSLTKLKQSLQLHSGLIDFVQGGEQRKTRPITDSEESSNERRIPMVLSIAYWEQFGNALKNFFDLQCWAKTVNICCVVEPSISLNSEERVFQFGRVHSPLTLGNIINMASWNNLSHRSNYSAVVSMAYFLKYASRQLVHVQLKYRTGSFQCRPLAQIVDTGWYKILRKRGFWGDTVCIDGNSPSFSDRYLADQIFKRYKGKNVTVIFDEWRGISSTNAKRLFLPGSSCQHSLKQLITPEMSMIPSRTIKYPKHFVTALHPSDGVVEVVDEFMKSYLGSNRVVAVVVRTEKLRNTSQECANAILSDGQLAKAQINTPSTLLFKDFGELGSVTFTRSHEDAIRLVAYLEEWIQPIIPTWKVDKVIANLSRIKNKVFLGMVVGALVARADCVVLVGGGAFHSSILNMYAHHHRSRECIYYRGAYCQRSFISQFNSL